MKNYPHPIVAKEGWRFLIFSLVLAIIATMAWGWWSVPLWIICLFILQFFRDPPREIPQGDNLVLCPADGRVLLVGNMRDPYRNVEALKVSVFMNVFNVHSNRSPVDATVKDVVYNKGMFVNASFDKASSDNERNALVLRTKDGIELSCVQIAGLIARRICCYVKPGDVLTRGQRYGFIRFGSRVDLYLPLGSKPRVAIGDKVKATTTVIAELPGR